MSWNRDELEVQRELIRDSLQSDSNLQDVSLNFLKSSYQRDYCYQWDWLGFPILQMPEDVVAYQELIFRCKPTVIIETGVAWGGSIALAASILSHLSENGRVIGIDLNLDPTLEARLGQLPLRARIELHGASSVDIAVVQTIAESITPDDRVMVVLDSHHSHDHVYQELALYSDLVSVGQYLIVGDTSVKDLAAETHRRRDWSSDLNPHSAVEAFLLADNNFIRDEVNNKLLTSFHPGGYLKRVAHSI